MNKMNPVFPVQTKSFPLHKDPYAFVYDTAVPAELIDEVTEKNLPDAMGTISLPHFQHGNRHKQWYHKTQAAFNDPLSAYFVLDAMVNSERGTYLRPLYLCQFLQTAVVQFYWTPTLIGRIMSGLEGACYSAYVEDSPGEFIPDTHANGDKLPESEVRAEIPFAKGRDSKGKYYVIDPRGGNEGVLWLMAARAAFYEKSQMSINGEKFGDFEAGRGNALTPVEWYKVVIPDTARDVQEYQNNKAGAAGRPFPKKHVATGDFLVSE
jgi:hypothetical protein